MIPALVALGVGAFLVVSFWDDIVDWLKSFARKIKEIFAKIGHAAKIFAQKIKGAIMRIIHILIYKEDGKWFEEKTTRELDESQVPEWAKAGVAATETDMTDKYKQKLSLAM